MDNHFQQPQADVFTSNNPEFRNNCQNFVNQHLRPIFSQINSGNLSARDNLLDLYPQVLNYFFNLQFRNLPDDLKSYIQRAKQIIEQVIRERRSIPAPRRNNTNTLRPAG